MIEKILEPYISERFMSDARYRKGHIRIINPLPGTSVLGLHIPDMRKIAARLASEEEQGGELIERFEAAPERSLYYEEYMVWGMMLNRMRLPLEERLDRLRVFVPHIDNWAVCDSVCAGAKWARPGDSLTKAFILELLASDREFEVRFGLILYMSRMMEESSLPEIFKIMESIDLERIRSDYRQGKVSKDSEDLCPGLVAGRPPYYVRMAMAWLMATALAKYPDLTHSLISRTSLPEDVLRLYVRKACESFRTRDISPF